ncbi:TIM-barrel domain-containing protein [Cohnella sp. GCM10027633]|uniref:TIM-barrel domain-containing protein n=1 Tax=unclassified Cohnella TaxID=2636738 RepID=UPI0036379083
MKAKPNIGIKRLAYPLMALLLFWCFVPSASAIDGVWHSPYGLEDRYVANAVERYPQDPVAGENVYIKLNTWPVEPGQAVWVTWTKNGVAQTVVNGSWQYNSGNDTFWQIALGSFSKGDVINYTVRADQYGTNQKTIGPFQFTVTGWESVASIGGHTDSGSHVVFNASPNTGSFSPKLNISFDADDVFRVQLSPNGTGTFATGLSNYTLTNNMTHYLVSTSELVLRIDKNPFKLTVYEEDGTTLITNQYDSTVNRNMAWLTDGSSLITKVEDHYYSPATEKFYGFGERYNNWDKRGDDIETYIYNQYLNQNEKTYLAIPYFISSRGYGILANSTYYSKFRMATERSDMIGFTVDTGGASTSMLDYHFFSGDDLKDVISNYAQATELPTLLPKWAFGIWLSANEWDRESEINTVLSNLSTHSIPASAIVLEQWSDEETFYIWNDATYTPKNGANAFSSSDFTYGTKWPDPEGMVDDIHNAGLKVLLWQTPAIKHTGSPYTQKDNDQAYMLAQDYAVEDGFGGEYRTPDGWFGSSPILDFTNSNAVDWWMSKREYLFDDIDIDGFKTDGGELVWGKNTTFSNGKKGDEMRNLYPNLYIGAYYDYAKSKKADAASFSRAGTTGVQKYPAFWAGDQESTFGTIQQSLMAGQAANISGVPYWSWDLAGFTGTFPSAELYKRSVEMSVFSPVMQIHSEKSNPPVNEERTPWNVQTRSGDGTVIDHFERYANIRMNLLPYIYSEATKTSATGVPLMRAMFLEYPSDSNTYDLPYQYMFGDNLLVAPIVDQGVTTKSVYLPAGEWIDFFYGALRPGNQTISYYADVNSIPVFVKSGSIIPMNLNASYELGGTIGNSLTSYTGLSFRVYPDGNTSYAWNDDIGGSVKTISSAENFPSDQVTVTVPATGTHAMLQVFATKPSSVTIGGSSVTQYSSLSSLTSNSQGWYFDPVQKLVHVKVASGGSSRTVVLNGVHKAAYEAEFATQTNVSTNNNHTGYTGTGFVDGFATTGDAVEFDVYAPSAGTYDVDIKYSSGAGNATRALYVGGTFNQTMTLNATANWDTWGTKTVSLSLAAGMNKIKVQYDSGNTLGINVDSLTLVE